MKSKELDVRLEFDSELDKGKYIIDVEPSVTIATKTF
jgi:hypothetical protein